MNDDLAYLRDLLNEATEYAGPEDDDLSNNAALWAAIGPAEGSLKRLQRKHDALRRLAARWDDSDGPPMNSTDTVNAFAEIARTL
jgi:hypothetical protein